MAHLFAYGTLMFPEVWRRVAGREPRRQEAIVRGYEVRRVRGDVFPVLAPNPHSVATGCVLYDVDEDTLTRLDSYENDFYERVEVLAEIRAGSAAAPEAVPCQAYVLAATRAEMATDEPWDPELFREQWLPEYLKRLAE
jgi:gamma-glutamylcyclotransferase (GGCT)/AIG2-like uncharacterized protein YtfP